MVSFVAYSILRSSTLVIEVVIVDYQATFHTTKPLNRDIV